MAKLYNYVGPEDIRRRAAGSQPGAVILSAHDLERWATQPGLLVLTFVVDPQGVLRVADRGSEHVACAGGGPVLSAGEMFFGPRGNNLEVVEVTNQSTGYCPEPESWAVVAAALDRAGISHPGRFTQEVIFRKCPACGQRNVVKDDWFVCGVCGKDLPLAWNF
jgi:hypothetical protein